MKTRNIPPNVLVEVTIIAAHKVKQRSNNVGDWGIGSKQSSRARDKKDIDMKR